MDASGATRLRERCDGPASGSAVLVAPADHDMTVIIPAYNEEQRLPWTLAELTSFLNGWGIDYRVLVADDGSTDCTATLAQQFGPRCSTLRVTPQGGKGRAVRIAMLRATGRVLAFTDADLPFQLTALRQGCEWIAAANATWSSAHATSKARRTGRGVGLPGDWRPSPSEPSSATWCRAK